MGITQAALEASDSFSESHLGLGSNTSIQKLKEVKHVSILCSDSQSHHDPGQKTQGSQLALPPHPLRQFPERTHHVLTRKGTDHTW